MNVIALNFVTNCDLAPAHYCQPFQGIPNSIIMQFHPIPFFFSSRPQTSGIGCQASEAVLHFRNNTGHYPLAGCKNTVAFIKLNIQKYLFLIIVQNDHYIALLCSFRLASQCSTLHLVNHDYMYIN